MYVLVLINFKVLKWIGRYVFIVFFYLLRMAEEIKTSFDSNYATRLKNNWKSVMDVVEGITPHGSLYIKNVYSLIKPILKYATVYI